MPRLKHRRSDSYVIKSGETRPGRVTSKPDGQTRAPSGADRRLARALLRTRKAK